VRRKRLVVTISEQDSGKGGAGLPSLNPIVGKLAPLQASEPCCSGLAQIGAVFAF